MPSLRQGTRVVCQERMGLRFRSCELRPELRAVRRVATLIGQCVQKIVPIKGTNDRPRVQCCVQPQVVGITQTMVLPMRDPKGLHGAARWASRSEINQMKTGLELGVDKVSGRAVRVSIEGVRAKFAHSEPR